MHLKMSSANWKPFCLGLNVLNTLLSTATVLGGPTNHTWHRWDRRCPAALMLARLCSIESISSISKHTVFNDLHCIQRYVGLSLCSLFELHSTLLTPDYRWLGLTMIATLVISRSGIPRRLVYNTIVTNVGCFSNSCLTTNTRYHAITGET